MWILQGTQSGNVFCITARKEFSVGRVQTCDIFLANPTVSRTHCIITIEPKQNDSRDITNTSVRTYLAVKDLSSFGTFVNKNKVAKGTVTTINDGEVLHFGDTAAEGYTVSYRPVVISCSSMSKADKETVRKQVRIAGAHFSPTWTKECTHLVMNTLTPTEKVFDAMLSLAPIVTPAWLQALVSKGPAAADMGWGAEATFCPQPPPGHDVTLPASGPYVVNHQRLSLFKGIVFCFMSETEKVLYGGYAERAGGESVRVKNPADIERVYNNAQRRSVSNKKGPSGGSTSITQYRCVVVRETSKGSDDDDAQLEKDYPGISKKYLSLFSDIIRSLLLCQVQFSFPTLHDLFPRAHPPPAAPSVQRGGERTSRQPTLTEMAAATKELARRKTAQRARKTAGRSSTNNDGDDDDDDQGSGTSSGSGGGRARKRVRGTSPVSIPSSPFRRSPRKARSSASPSSGKEGGKGKGKGKEKGKGKGKTKGKEKRGTRTDMQRAAGQLPPVPPTVHSSRGASTRKRGNVIPLDSDDDDDDGEGGGGDALAGESRYTTTTTTATGGGGSSRKRGRPVSKGTARSTRGNVIALDDDSASASEDSDDGGRTVKKKRGQKDTEEGFWDTELRPDKPRSTGTTGTITTTTIVGNNNRDTATTTTTTTTTPALSTTAPMVRTAREEVNAKNSNGAASSVRAGGKGLVNYKRFKKNAVAVPVEEEYIPTAVDPDVYSHPVDQRRPSDYPEPGAGTRGEEEVRTDDASTFLTTDGKMGKRGVIVDPTRHKKNDDGDGDDDDDGDSNDDDDDDGGGGGGGGKRKGKGKGKGRGKGKVNRVTSALKRPKR